MGTRGFWGNVLFAFGGLTLVALIVLAAVFGAGLSTAEMMPDGDQGGPAGAIGAIFGGIILVAAVSMLVAGWKLTRPRR